MIYFEVALVMKCRVSFEKVLSYLCHPMRWLDSRGEADEEKGKTHEDSLQAASQSPPKQPLSCKGICRRLEQRLSHTTID